MREISRRDLLKAGATLACTSATFTGYSPVTQADQSYADAVLTKGEPAPLMSGAFTIAVLPDTQHYSEKHPDTFRAQTEWIVRNKEDRNIVYVLQLGDITNHNTPREWDNAVAALNVLDGKLPYFFVPGNHDYSEKGGCKDRTTLLNEYLPVSKFSSLSTFGGTYDKEPERMENSYHLFAVGDRKFLVLGLEFGPRRDVVRWANEVVARHKDREAILITHAYMYFDDTRYNWAKHMGNQSWNPHAYGVAHPLQDVMDGEELWNNLVSKHENFILTINGHVLNDGLGYLASPTPSGRDVHQMLVNFQMRPRGGDGWLRLLEFRPEMNYVQTYDYSPTRDEHNASSKNQFRVKLASIA